MTFLEKVLQAVVIFGLVTFLVVVASSLLGCDSNHIIGDPPIDGELECRTISVDQCFALQCGYQVDLPDVEGGIFEVVANELFCPEDFCDFDVVETDTDECDLTVPVGHRPIECRGRGR
jgi:hypothetical protein